MVVGILYSLSPWSNSAVALVLGTSIALFFSNPFSDKTKIYSPKLLTYSVVGLGAGMNLSTVAKAGLSGIGFTAISITGSLFLGLAFGKLFKSESKTSILISVGTAICGGSAIAAVAPVIKAKPQSISVALGTVFLLNALALIIFPPIGHYLNLTQDQFGLWSALAIHDTSSVVGAGLQFGPQALEIGTTIKLARALWIVPLTFGFSFFARRTDQEIVSKTKKPWFILGFLFLAALVTWIPALHGPGKFIEMFARKILVLTLFLIGSNLSLSTLKSVGFRPLLQGVCLWLIVSLSTLLIMKC